MRVLAATTAGVGHFAGLLPFARACVRAGHEVRVAAPASFAATVEGAGLLHEPLGDADPAELGAVFGRLPSLSMQEADDLVIREVFGRVDRDAALPAMRTTLDRWRPDVVLREPAELASYVGASERDIPQVQTNIGVSALDDRMLPLFEQSLADIRVDASGLHSAPRWTTVPDSFDKPAGRVTASVTRARDTAAGPAAAPPLPSWWRIDDDTPLVYATFGSVAAGIGLYPAFYVHVVDQVADLDARVLLTLGEAGDPAELGPLPRNVHVERWWPQRDVLPHAAVVVGHGGFGTTQAALAAAVPQVVLPLFSFDQFANAERVSAVGVGVALTDGSAAERRSGDFLPRGPQATDRLAGAVRDVLEQPRYAAVARALAAEIDGLPPVDACVSGLERPHGS